MPDRVWGLIAMLCLHPHCVLLRPCRVELPFRIDAGERELWYRLMDAALATLVVHAGGADFERDIEIHDSGEACPQPSPLAPRQMVKDLGLSDVVRVTGQVPESFEYVRHADLFVLPSLEEGSGSMSILEAMQAGVPVIATRIDGIPEDVTDGDNGLLVESGNVSQLAAAIRRLLESPELRIQLGRRSYETFQRRFSADALTAGLMNAYGRLI